MFRIKAPHWQLFLRLIPYIKIPIDLFQYHFENWTLNHSISLFDLPEKAKILSIYFSINNSPFPKCFLGFHLIDESLTFAPFDLISEKIGFTYTLLITLFLLSISFVRVIFFLIKIYKETLVCEKITNKFSVKLLSPLLIEELKRKKVDVVVAQRENFSPYIQLIRKRQIVLPANILNLLSIEEINCLIAHEIKHTNFILLCLYPITLFFKSVFFFIPLQKLFQTIEKVCDFNLHRFNLSPIKLSTAINKIARASSSTNRILAMNFTNRYSTFERIKSILTVRRKRPLFAHIAFSLLFFFLFSLIIAEKIGHF